MRIIPERDEKLLGDYSALVYRKHPIQDRNAGEGEPGNPFDEVGIALRSNALLYHKGEPHIRPGLEM